MSEAGDEVAATAAVSTPEKAQPAAEQASTGEGEEQGGAVVVVDDDAANAPQPADSKRVVKKRDREQALGPSTPISEEDVKLTTPAHKKGRTATTTDNDTGDDGDESTDKEATVQANTSDEAKEPTTAKHITKKVKELTYDEQQQQQQPSKPASGFSAFASKASPFASAATAATPLAKGKASDEPSQSSPTTAAPVKATTQPDPVSVPATSTATSSSTSSTAAAAAPEKPVSSSSASTAAEAVSKQVPETPVAPKTAASTLASASSKPLSTASPFASFASKSGFAAVSSASTSKAPASGSAFGSFASGTASPFASVKTGAKPVSEGQGTASTALSGDKEASTGEGPADREASPEAIKRVYKEQELVTGEEEEEVVHSVRCKLYAMVDGAWAERGTGPMRINRSRDVSESKKPTVRLVMRAEATHRLLLNAPLFASFVIEVSNEKYVRFAIIDHGEPTSYMLRMGNPNAAESFVAIVKSTLEDL